MSLTGRQLSDGDIHLLEKLNQQSVELGDLPRPSAERLISMGLARIVLGTCEITRAGQLTCQRDRHRRPFRERWLRLTPRSRIAAAPRLRDNDTDRSDTLFSRRWISRLAGALDARN